MGVELESFVHPERISSQLICPICTQVLDRPVQTPSEHLFCEDELLEWMTRSQFCPVTNSKLEPDSIKRPGRVILNMLAELERYCPHRCEGCEWVGQSDQVAVHVKLCRSKPKEELIKTIEEKDTVISKLRKKLSLLQQKWEELEEENAELSAALAIANRKLRVYDAFFKSESSGGTGASSPVKAGRDGGPSTSQIAHLNRLRELSLLIEGEEECGEPSQSPQRDMRYLGGAGKK